MQLTYVALHEVTWCMVEWCTHNTLRQQQFQWHQPCQCHKYPTLVDIKKMHCIKLSILSESQVSAASLLEGGELLRMGKGGWGGGREKE